MLEIQYCLRGRFKRHLSNVMMSI